MGSIYDSSLPSSLEGLVCSELPYGLILATFGLFPGLVHTPSTVVQAYLWAHTQKRGCNQKTGGQSRNTTLQLVIVSYIQGGF